MNNLSDQPARLTITEPGALRHPYWVVEDGRSKFVDGGIIEESLLTIYVNLEEVATIMCSPLDQEALALGFLYNEGVIDSLDEVRLVKLNNTRTAVDIFLYRSDFQPPRRMLLTSGCGGGVTWQAIIETNPGLDSDYTSLPATLSNRMLDLYDAAHLYNQVRGVHTSILANQDKLLICAEDVGRHNTIDKIAGRALQMGLDTRDQILISSGRISSEMLNKARRMKIPIVASRTAPTSIAVRLAQAWNICVVGYVRRNRMQVYTHPQRLGLR